MDEPQLSTTVATNTMALPYLNQGDKAFMADIVYRAEASKILGVDPKTWDKYVKQGLLGDPDHEEKRKNGVIIKGFERKKVIAFKRKLVRRRKPGFSLISED